MSNHPILRGRRRSLDRNKKRLVCDAVSRGATMGEAAQLVGVSLRTVQREARLDAVFDHQLRVAHTDTPDPLAIMQSAARTHWRAAAWLLERENPDDYGRRPAASCSPYQFERAMTALLERALELAPPEVRSEIYAALHAQYESIFSAVFPTFAPRARRAIVALHHTPLADAEQLIVLHNPKYSIPDPFVADKDAPEASPERAVGFTPTVPNGASNDAKQPPHRRVGVRTHLPAAEPTELAPDNALPAATQHPESSIKHPASESASDAPSPTHTPTLTPTRISSLPSPQPPTDISRLPWRYILRAARTTKSLVPGSAPSASSLPEPVLSHLSPETRVATEFTDDTTPLAAPPHSASPPNPVE
jgi:hypothetical protein